MCVFCIKFTLRRFFVNLISDFRQKYRPENYSPLWFYLLTFLWAVFILYSGRAVLRQSFMIKRYKGGEMRQKTGKVAAAIVSGCALYIFLLYLLQNCFIIFRTVHTFPRSRRVFPDFRKSRLRQMTEQKLCAGTPKETRTNRLSFSFTAMPDK